MTALPMTLETALRYQGYTIDSEEFPETTITVDDGTIVVPAMVGSVLTWQRGTPPSGVDPELGDDLYLSSLPMFSEDYRPILLSSILDRYRTRRLGYNTPGEFRLAFRRWGNMNMRALNLRYASTAVALPLDNVSLEETSHGLDVDSEFPQSLISGSQDYASSATDRRVADNRNGRTTSVMELLEAQRATYLNVDEEVMAGLDTLFLQVFDQGESGAPNVYDPPEGPLAGFWNQPAGYFGPVTW